MSKNLFTMGCLAMFSLTTPAQSTNQVDSLKQQNLNEVVITGTRFSIPVEKSGKTIYKLSSQDIKQNAGKSVADLLNEVPGIQIDGNFGAPGNNISTYIRGGRSKNTLILVDGIPQNDPSGINATYDLRLLSVNQIESIEVLKGGLSTLYGTGASAAVINIKLKEATADTSNGSIDINIGSFETLNTSAHINGRLNKFSYLVSGNLLTSEGFSSAIQDNSATPFDKDGLNQKNVLFKLRYKFGPKFNIEGFIGLDDFETEYDDGPFLDAENIQLSSMRRIGITPTFTYSKGQIQLKSAYIDNDREFISSFPIAYHGRNIQVDLNQKHQFTTNLIGFWGTNLQSFSYVQDESKAYNETHFTLFDPYLSFFYQGIKNLTLHIGGRLNTHSEYGEKMVYNINPSYLLAINNNLKVKFLTSLSSSYITPSGYQLFSDYGNLELTPEEALNFEIGTAFIFKDILTFNLDYFERAETEAIDFVSEFDSDGNFVGGGYQNLMGNRDIRGFEADLNVTLSEKVTFLANYSFVTTDDLTTFYRIPKNKFGATLRFLPDDKTAVFIKYNFTGSRMVYDFGSGGVVDLNKYQLVDLYLQHGILNNKLSIYGGINNVLDVDFVSAIGFTNKGRNFNIGATFTF